MAADLSNDYEVCPHCGAELRLNALFCRQCGASEDSGWGDDSEAWSEPWTTSDNEEEEDSYQADDFDYDEFISREFPEYAEPSNKHQRARWFTGLIVAIVCVAFLLFVLANW